MYLQNLDQLKHLKVFNLIYLINLKNLMINIKKVFFILNRIKGNLHLYILYHYFKKKHRQDKYIIVNFDHQLYFLIHKMDFYLNVNIQMNKQEYQLFQLQKQKKLIFTYTIQILNNLHFTLKTSQKVSQYSNRTIIFTLFLSARQEKHYNYRDLVVIFHLL